MLLAWTVCRVPEERREAFDQAQRAYRRIRYAEGFVVQVGGFVVGEAETACIVSAWRDAASERVFTDGLYGVVAHGEDTMDGAPRVRRYSVIARMPGQRPRLHEAWSAAKLLRATELTVHRFDAFARTQLDVWTPRLAGVKGMFGGVWARGEPRKILSVTGWQDDEHHTMFEEHHLGAIREESGRAGQVEAEDTRLVEVEREWTVVGVGG